MMHSNFHPSQNHKPSRKTNMRLLSSCSMALCLCFPTVLLADLQATFKTKLGGRYVTAENAGGAAVTANRAAAQEWETFQLIDKNGGALQSGDLVFLKTSKGFYVQAPPQAANSRINANSRNQLDWETFRMVKVGGSGVILG